MEKLNNTEWRILEGIVENAIDQTAPEFKLLFVEVTEKMWALLADANKPKLSDLISEVDLVIKPKNGFIASDEVYEEPVEAKPITVELVQKYLGRHAETNGTQDTIKLVKSIMGDRNVIDADMGELQKIMDLLI